MHVSERRACAALGQHRSTQRKVPRGRDDEECLTADTIALARQYGRYGYRKIAGLLEQAGWLVNDKRVERIWRREGLEKLAAAGRFAPDDTVVAIVTGNGLKTLDDHPPKPWPAKIDCELDA